MPNPTIAGGPILKGLNNGTSASTLTYTGVTATLKPLSGTHTQEFDLEEVKDGNGNIISLGAVNQREYFEFELLLTGSDAAAARGMVKPTPLKVITLANLQVTEDEGTYNYVGGFSKKFSDQACKVSMKLARFNGAALTVL